MDRSRIYQGGPAGPDGSLGDMAVQRAFEIWDSSFFAARVDFTMARSSYD